MPDERAAPELAPVTADVFVGQAIPRPRWAIRNVWPEGAMGVIGGAPKNGKSSFGLELAVSLATGTPFLGLRDQFPMVTPPAPVLYVQVENSKGRVQRDLQEVLTARGLGFFDEEIVDHQAEVVDPNDPNSEVVEWDVKVRTFHPHPDRNLSRLHVLSNVSLQLEDEECQEWIRSYVRENRIRYLFLDPLYMLTAVDYEQKPQSIRGLLTFFTQLKAEDGCAVVLTHHQTSKHTNGSSASRLLGATYIYGWYEAALFTTRDGNLFTLEVDSLRELGVYESYTLTGSTIGSWTFDPHTQNKTDALGRKATRTAQMEAKVSAFALLLGEHPDWTNQQLADELGVTVKTITNYRSKLAERTAA